MKNRYSYFLLFLLAFTFFSFRSNATHIAAADIYITYVGGGADGCSGTSEYKYVVTLDVYAACETGSARLGPTARVDFASTNAGFASFVNMNNPIRDTLDDLCAAFKPVNACRTPANQQYTAYIRHRWQDTIVLPSAQKDWRFWYTTGARNRGIDNIETTVGSQNPQGNLYIEAGLNNLAKYNNSTPRFMVRPLPYICVNQPAVYLNGPFDPNGDSLNTELQTPLNNNATTPYFYRTDGGRNYSALDPIDSDPSNPFKLDGLTGTATFTPQKVNKLVMAFKCTEYERGTNEVLGYIMRDVQISVFPCASPPPVIDAVPPDVISGELIDINGQKGIIACPGSDISFDINTKSANSTSAVYMEANTTTIPGSNFTTNGDGTQSVTGKFTWTPAASDIGEHTLIITTKDSTCSGSGFSIVLKNYTVILLKIVGGLDAGEDIPFCEINPNPVQLFVKGADYVDVQWSTVDGSPTFLDNDNIVNPLLQEPKRTVEYIVQSPQLKGACKARDTVKVMIDESNKVQITPKNPTEPENAMVMCRPGYLQLEALISGRPPKNNVVCGTGNPTLCTNPITATVYGSSVYGKLDYDSLGSNTPVMYNSLRTTKQQFLIRRSEMADADIFSSTIRSIGFETVGTSSPTYQYSNFKILVKCTNKSELKKDDGFENFGMVEVYSAPFVTFEDGLHTYPFSLPYNWDTTKNLIVQICYSDNPTVEVGCGVTSSPPVVKYVPTTYVSGLLLAGVDATALSVCGTDKDARIRDIPARPTFTFSYCEADPLPFDIVWKEGEYLSDTTITTPLAYVPGSSKYVVQTIGRSGCIMRDTLEVYVPKHDFKVTPQDTAICYGVGTPVSAYGGWYYKWYEYDGTDEYKDATGSLNCPTCPEPFVRPAKTTDYRIVISDSVYCYDTFKARVEILPLPDVHILNQDTTIKYGKSFQLLVSGARLYNWSPVSSLSNPNVSYPTASPTEDTRFVVGGIGATGCRAFDTVYVTVDNRDHLQVPSAFSPNGDGRNDVFRVSNLTFERIQEFRVFNRWGQEIFGTTGSNRGWDGTWKGTPQDVGTYSYLIRVGFPDGQVETYRGEVTLIR
ncbi:MAG: gliding motility-associated C-terminal domain-containing protein [Chitinophagaceae bacterium]|nr:gliding motility-associated C-terminal domain-containing protein [Chitinophagaceae bacterium]